VERTRAAHAENGERIAALFREAGLSPDGKAKASDKEFLLMEYYDQILRDWAWDQDGQRENARALELLEEAMAGDTRLGKVLVLGAGPCRLAHDLHQRFAPTLTVALDINPLLLLVGKQVIFDGGMKLYEFPPDPRGIELACVDHSLRAAGPPPGQFFPVLADAFSAPLATGQFDTVVTPWFIDIVPVDLRETLGLLHGLLAPGGRWLNYGPLSYQADRVHSHRYTPEEVYELIGLAAFDLGPPTVNVIDYMQSKAAARGKVVDVITFAARRRPVAEIPADAVRAGGAGASGSPVPPAWLVLPHLPVPRFAGLAGYKPDHPMLVYLVGLIDGERSMAQMARKMIDEHGARPDAALAGTRAMMAIVLEAVQP
jgi:hypothetical protein